MASTPDRVRAAVALLDPRPGERILEVGGGPGAAAALICPRLGAGRLTAVDRSAIATERSAVRNAEHVAAGTLVHLTCELAELTVPPGDLDAAFGVNVNVFWTREPTAELTRLHDALRPGGRLLILYGAAGPTGPSRVVPPIAAAVRRAGLVDVTAVGTAALVGVSARRPG